MSRRHFLNISMGSTAFLLLIAIGAVFVNPGGQEDYATQIELAENQIRLVDDLNRQASELAEAEDYASVIQARKNLAGTILRFDSTLSALMHGGALKDIEGARVEVKGAKSGPALEALQYGATLWSDVGLPLADLAAGDFSIFSAAGQQAVEGLRAGSVELAQHMEAAAKSLDKGTGSGNNLAGAARGMAMILAIVLIGLGYLRMRMDRRSSGTDKQSRSGAQQASSEGAATPVFAGSSSASGPGFEGFTSPVDFDNVNASVDQMSVDMNTIAGSTDKMRLAIDSVGHAMQGMLFSLNEMAQDTAEGYKVVRGANNAASYTATAADELASSSREMSQVVARVTQLALKTKQVATQIDAEAVHTGETGEAFTSVVAGEVKGLASQTSKATADIDNTVSEIMATARQYEEAISQIIRNIAGINKISQNLGELMLHPPQTVVPGTPLPAAVIQPAPLGTPAAPAPLPAAVAPEAPVAPPEPAAAAATPEPVVTEAATPPAAAAKEEEVKSEAPVEASAPESAAPADPWGGIIDDPVGPEPTTEEVAEKTSAAIEESAESAEDKAPAGSSGNVFMLGGGPKKKRTPPPAKKAEPAAAEPAAEEPVAEKPVAETPEPAPAPAPAPEPAAEEKPSSNIFMLGKPKKAAAPAAEEPAAAEAPVPETAEKPAPEETATEEPVAETPAPEPEAEAEEEVEDDSGSNIYNLKRPMKKKGAASAETPEAAQPEPVPVAAGAEPAAEPEAKEEKKPGGSNIFMLGKKK
ncbi:MAG: hypothetical protein KOO60_09130 [Gemmatimonadales bacterium]|nr:hypothetical protein [Gemmatimonadales bacterium]